MDTIFTSTTLNGFKVKAKNPSSTGRLDIGEGKEVDLVEICPRSKLHQQCIKYLGPMERKAYEVIVEDGKLLYKQSGLLVDTIGEPNGAKWIFVLSTSMNLYVGQKKKGSFQHSSFLAGGATSAAGRIVVENGNLKAVWPHSGHYRPTPENFQDFIAFLKGNNVDLTNVKMDAVDKEEEEYSRTQSSVVLRSISSEQVGWTRQIQRKIKCMDMTNYTFKLQCHALEQVNLSPRIAGYFRSNSTRESIPNSFIGEIHIRKTSYSGELPRIRHLTPQSSPVRKEASTTRAAAKQQEFLQVSVSL